MTMGSDSPSTPRKPFQLKKPRFNKATFTPPKLQSGRDIFSKTDSTYAAIAEKEERRNKKHVEKTIKKAQDHGHDVGSSSADRHRNKKAKLEVIDITEDDGDDESSSSEAPEKVTPSKGTPSKGSSLRDALSSIRKQSPATLAENHRRLLEKPSRFNSNHKEANLSPQSPPPPPRRKAEVIDLYNSADDISPEKSPVRAPSAGKDDEIQITSVTTRNVKPAEHEEDGESDEEFAELARQAREKARRKRLGLEDPPKPASDSQATLKESVASNDSFRPDSQTSQSSIEPTIELLITSRLPGTDALVIKRRIGQRLGDARTTWCARQGYEDSESSGIFLVFRGRRCFDFNSFKSLGIGADATGNATVDGEKDLLAKSEGKIHMEAMTEEMYELSLKQKAEEARRKEQPIYEEDLPPPEPQEPVEKKTRIILKARNLDELKIVVKDVSSLSTNRVLRPR